MKTSGNHKSTRPLFFFATWLYLEFFCPKLSKVPRYNLDANLKSQNLSIHLNYIWSASISVRHVELECVELCHGGGCGFDLGTRHTSQNQQITPPTTTQGGRICEISAHYFKCLKTSIQHIYVKHFATKVFWATFLYLIIFIECWGSWLLLNALHKDGTQPLLVPTLSATLLQHNTLAAWQH